jgi:prolyl-tRNA synthetase
MIMGCYGIGVTRTVQAVIEQNFDKDGIVWPASVAPCQVTVLPLDAAKSPECAAATDKLVAELEARGIDVLVDDRDERPGVKFKDADLIGCTIRVVVGNRSLQQGGVEVRVRKTGESSLIPVDVAAEQISEMLKGL